MSELYRHLLIPQDPACTPELGAVARFFRKLGDIGALPSESKFTVVAQTGRTRAWGKNPKTGEEYYGPELKISRSLELSDALESAAGEQDVDLVAEANGPAALPPFELYSADNYASRLPGILWQKAYTFSVRCRLRTNITHLLHSPFGCKCDLKPDEPAVFENPWSDRPIQTGALGCARFWIEFGIGDYLMPMVTDSLEILDPRLVYVANDVFGIEFAQGCIRNDD